MISYAIADETLAYTTTQFEQTRQVVVYRVAWRETSAPVEVVPA